MKIFEEKNNLFLLISPLIFFYGPLWMLNNDTNIFEASIMGILAILIEQVFD